MKPTIRYWLLFGLLWVIGNIWAQYNPSNPSEPGAYYSLTLKATPSGAGTFNISSPATYAAGVNVRLRATAKTNYTFVAWAENGIIISTSAQYDYQMPDRNVTLTAHFDYTPSSPGEPTTPVIDTYANLYVSCSPSAGGSVNITSGSRYKVGSSVSLKATASTGFTFANWTQDNQIISTVAQFNYVMQSAGNDLVANFTYTPSNPGEPTPTLPTYVLTLQTSPSTSAGKINISSGKAYQAGTSINLVATPKSGYRFVRWTSEGTVLATSASFTYIMPARSVTVKAEFEAVYNPSSPGEPGQATNERHNIFGMTENAVQGQSILYPIYLENTTQVMNMYVDVTFPEGFVVDTAGSNMSSRVGNHWLEQIDLGNNAWRMRIRGTDVVSGVNGKVLEIPVTIPENAQMGQSYLVALTHGVVMRPDSTQIPVGVRSGQIYVRRLLEDGLFASFSYDKFQTRVGFQNHSAGNITSVLWDFGDGEQSTDFSPVHTYASSGMYTIRLTIRGETEEDMMETMVFLNDSNTWKTEGSFRIDNTIVSARNFSTLQELAQTLMRSRVTGNVVINILSGSSLYYPLNQDNLDLLTSFYSYIEQAGKSLTLRQHGSGRAPVIHFGTAAEQSVDYAQTLLASCTFVNWQHIETHLFGTWFDFGKYTELNRQSIASGTASEQVDFTHIAPSLSYSWHLSEQTENIQGGKTSGSGVLPRMQLLNSGEGSNSLRYTVNATKGSTPFCVFSHVITVDPALVGLFRDLAPADSAILDATNITLSWNRIVNAKYDLYLWDAANAMPATPVLSDSYDLRYTSTGFYRFGHSYHWMVVAHNGSQRLASDTMTFSIRQLPNLHVSALSCSEAAAEQPLTVEWSVANHGPGATGNQHWKDYIWLVTDVYRGTVSETNDSRLPKLLGQYENVKALASGESYSNSAEVTMPNGVYGDCYLLVTSDMYNVTDIEWSAIGGGVINPYEPTTTGSGYTYLFGKTNAKYNLVYEEGETTTRSDNFRYKKLQLGAPQMPDLQVTRIVAEALPIGGPTLPDGGINEAYFTPTPLTQAGIANNADWYSGKRVQVLATIANKGQKSIKNQSWRNGVYLSSSIDRSTVTPMLMQTKSTSSQTLEPEDTVQVRFLFQMPYAWSGTTFLHVMADIDNSVNELANTPNNWSVSDSIQVAITPGADFVPSDLQVPHALVAEQEFDIHYHVQNEGTGVPYTYTWKDKVWISTSADGLNNQARLIATFTRKGSYISIPSENEKIYGRVPASSFHYQGDTYDVQEKIRVSGLRSGTYYFYIKTDADNDVHEPNGEQNNILRSEPVSFVEPDIIVESLVLSTDTFVTGDVVAISWVLRNTGTVDIRDRAITDALYTTVNQDGTNASLLCTLQNTVTIAAGAEKHMRANISVPKNAQLNGLRYLYLNTNNSHSVKESDESNNRSALQRVWFTYTEEEREQKSIGPALSVDNIGIPATSHNGDTILLSCAVKNVGDRRVPADVSKEVFLTPQSDFNISNAIPCAVEVLEGSTDSLRSESKVVLRMRVIIPPNIRGGNKYLHVYVDRQNVIQSKNTSRNRRSKEIYIQSNMPDLRIENVQCRDSVVTSTTDTIRFTVRNAGEWVSGQMSTKIFLSKAADVNRNHVQLASVRIPRLQPGAEESYQVTYNLTDKQNGKWYIRIVPEIRETNLTDQGKQSNRQVVAVLPELPDLQADRPSVQGTLIAGEPMRITYSIRNTGNTATHQSRWADEFWLSPGTVFDPSVSIQLGSRTHNGALGSGQAYSAEVEYTTPIDLQGNYMLYLRTDAANAVVEEDEYNNDVMIPVYINNADDRPADLVVQSLIVPSSIIAGEPVTIAYNVYNRGEFPAKACLRDIFYLSSDAEWDMNDALVGVASGDVDIAPGESVARVASGVISHVPEGYWYLIVSTNSTHSVIERDYVNNSTASLSPTEVTFTSLSLGSTVELNANGYYKIQIPDGMNGKNARIRLNHPGDVSAGLFASFETIPSTARYDVRSSRIQDAEELLLSNMRPGNYYLLAQDNAAIAQSEGNEFSLGTYVRPAGANMTLSAEEVNFGATSLSMQQGGNGGWVTTDINGALFDSIMDFRLTNSDVTLPAEVITWNGLTQSAVTFNLTEAAEGVYSVVSELPNGMQSTLTDAFEVVKGKSVDLGLRLDVPSTIRAGAYVPFTLAYANGGTTDIEIAEITIVIDHGGLAFSLEDLEQNPQTKLHYYPHPETNSRGYVSIRPGEQEVVKMFFVPNSECSIAVYIVR